MENHNEQSEINHTEIEIKALACGGIDKVLRNVAVALSRDKDRSVTPEDAVQMVVDEIKELHDRGSLTTYLRMVLENTDKRDSDTTGA